ncbi:CapA family protein [Acinetobacter pittii]|uniref:CapA family protein n=2 Tax=Acinetobacter pittii TaxID=48296 RepID=A0A429KLG3_ACIPI|nr:MULTISPECIES: CapA family protein [Acinetobacter]AMM27044.1 metallophosphatase [Acinetobacter pittii]EXB01284.1 bacterial capsule synthesis PGA_cap family protein [Acinetobacter sp. 1295259]KQE19314.1 metallophosphatase [Acinetobacter pittii]KQF20862.1 metallophosphatase [Acinetobacter pittii]KRI49626.1 metallophosphatase [Acinetobacter pittii]
MKYQPVEIKLLTHIDTTNFDEAIWQFEFDDDISTLLLIDYALEQFQQKKVQAQDVYVVPQDMSKHIGQQNLGLKASESYTFTELLQFLIFTQAVDVKEALSSMLCGTNEQAYLIFSKRAATYNLALKNEATQNQLKHLFLLLRKIYSYPNEIKKLFFIKELNFQGKSYLPQTSLMAQNVVEVLYLTNSFRKIYLTFFEENQTIGFFLFLDDIHRAEHLIPYYHCFQAQTVRPKVCSAPSGIINILGDTYFGEIYTEKRKARRQTDSLQQYGYNHSFEKLKTFLGEHDLNIANFEAVFSLENQSPLDHKKPFILKADAEQTLAAFKNIHLNHVVLANNHLKDYGDRGLTYTLQQLDQANISYIGAGVNQKDAHNYFELSFENKRYAIFNGYWHRDTAYLDYDFYALGHKSGVACLNGVLLEQIGRYRLTHPEHKIIVICHWGVDFKHITKEQNKLATILTQAGADLIIGHGAHTIQPVQIINQKPVVFGIGNAVFNSNGEYEKHNALPFGCIARLDLSKDLLRLYPIYTNNLKTFWQPYPVNVEDFLKASTYMTSLLTPENYIATQDNLGAYIEIKF